MKHASFANSPLGFLKGNDLSTKLIGSAAWSATSIGGIGYWPQSLKNAVNIILNTKLPMLLFWGPELIQFINTPHLAVFDNNQDLHGEVGKPGAGLWIKKGLLGKEVIDEVLKTGKAALTTNRAITIYRDDCKTEAYFSCSYAPIIDEDHTIAGIFITCIEECGIACQTHKDNYNETIRSLPLTNSNEYDYDSFITDKKQTYTDETKIQAIMKNHLALFNAEERLRLATEVTGIGSWDIDLQLHTIIYTPTLMLLFGVDQDAIMTLEEINKLVHPEDKKTVDDALANAIITGHYHYEARLIWPDASVHWISTNGRVTFDALNVPARLMGTTVDITANKMEQIEKNDFIAIASHELKTPLTSIKAYLQMLKSGQGITDPEYVANIAARAENQVIKMTKLIYSFLDMSRIESGHIDLCIEPFMMDDLINEVVKDYSIHSNTHELIFEPGITEPVEGDRSRLGQVIDNLLSNAIKYSPLCKKILISSAIYGDEVIVSVKDCGIGIDAKHQEKVFERFYRADDQKAINAAGFGIGLYLSADILKRHNGGIWMESDREQGTTFHFSLPRTCS